jgi:hypothetical protein
MKTIAIFPGRFQPFGRHHAEAYEWLSEMFGEKNTYIATSNILDENSPFNFLEKKFVNHALSYLIILQLIWIIITSITSTMPVVSIKFFISRLWLVGSSFYFASYLFKHLKNIYSFIILLA